MPTHVEKLAAQIDAKMVAQDYDGQDSIWEQVEEMGLQDEVNRVLDRLVNTRRGPMPVAPPSTGWNMYEAAKLTDEKLEVDEAPKPAKVSRRRSIQDPTLGESIVQIIAKADHRLSRAEIWAELDPKPSLAQWNEQSKAQVQSGKIDATGERKGRRYGIPGREYTTQVVAKATQKAPKAPRAAKKGLDQAKYQAVLKVLTKDKQSRAQILEAVRKAGVLINTNEWIEISKALKTDPKITQTGQKKGTRYQKKGR